MTSNIVTLIQRNTWLAGTFIFDGTATGVLSVTKERQKVYKADTENKIDKSLERHFFNAFYTLLLLQHQRGLSYSLQAMLVFNNKKTCDGWWC